MLWKRANDIHQRWKNNKMCGTHKLYNLLLNVDVNFYVNYNKYSLETMVDMFLCGWIPMDDNEYVEFLNY